MNFVRIRNWIKPSIIERMAAGKTADRQKQAAQSPVLFKRLCGVLGTGGVKTT